TAPSPRPATSPTPIWMVPSPRTKACTRASHLAVVLLFVYQAPDPLARPSVSTLSSTAVIPRRMTWMRRTSSRQRSNLRPSCSSSRSMLAVMNLMSRP
ncbi:hypothetical protein E4U43_006511, partial [Claviceps pusilla]